MMGVVVLGSGLTRGATDAFWLSGLRSVGPILALPRMRPDGWAVTL
jgi:hypothetical protein